MKTICSMEIPESKFLYTAAFHPFQSVVYMAGGALGSEVVEYDFNQNKILRRFSIEVDWVMNLKISLDGKFLIVICYEDQRSCIYNLQNGERIFKDVTDDLFINTSDSLIWIYGSYLFCAGVYFSWINFETGENGTDWDSESLLYNNDKLESYSVCSDGSIVVMTYTNKVVSLTVNPAYYF